MKRTIGLVIFLFALVGLFTAPALAAEDNAPSIYKISFSNIDTRPSGEEILLDALFMRPLGLAAIAVGTAGVVAAAPWMITSCGCEDDDVHRELVRKPWSYTFERKLGHIEHLDNDP